ncbi:MAG: GNAT family N-acetyltransferase [Vicinamibacterales bacterium]
MTAHITRLTPADAALARETFLTMAAVFETDAEPLGDDYLARLLEREDFWALAAVDGPAVVGGLTAHVLPMTTSETRALFIYDLAVVPDRQRHGIGRRLVEEVRALALSQGIDDVFVPAENEDTHALAFYRALGGTPTAATFFSFPAPAGRSRE